MRHATLRTRLLLSIVALLAAVSIIIGVVSVVALRSSLIEKVDAQVVAATSRSQSVVDGPRGGDGRPGPGDFLPFAGLQPGTLGGIIDNGRIVAAILGNDVQATLLTDAQALELVDLRVNAAPETVNLGGDLGEFRVAIRLLDANTAVVIGMPLSDVNATVGQLVLVVSLVVIAGLIAAFLAGSFIVRLALRPLDRVAATATHVSELPLDRGEVALAVRVPEHDADPATEVGQVGAAINRMLGHVASALTAREASERKVRDFVADASHELRTPLASIRGYAELTRRSNEEIPPDVARSLARIEAESVRMTALVEDLLLLARLDSGRDLELAAVDLGPVLADAVSDAAAAGLDHEWALELPEEPVLVRGDASRLLQVFGNLLTNARVHTPAGSNVVVAAALSERTAIVTVTDDGPGIDAAVRDSVFERFSRADASRSRAAGSTGLGLAIVAAIVEAHGGSVAATTGDAGTTFTVSLPLASDAALPA